MTARPPELEPVTCADLLTTCTHDGPHVVVGLDGQPTGEVWPATSAGQDTDERHCARCGQIPYVHGLPDSTCVYEPTEAAGQDTGQMRDESLRFVAEHFEMKSQASMASDGTHWHVCVCGARVAGLWFEAHWIDALLDGPLRQLIDQRDQARAQVQRVRELAAGWDTNDDARYGQNRIAKHTAARELRRALDGPA